MASNDNHTDNNVRKDKYRVDIENNENVCGAQNVSSNTGYDPLPQPIDAFSSQRNIHVESNVIMIEAVIEEKGVEAPQHTLWTRAPLPPYANQVTTPYIDTMFCDTNITCRTCMSGFMQNLELYYIFPLNLFLAVYQLIAVINFDSYCFYCKSKSAVFDARNITLNDHRYYASDVTHWSICSLVIITTLVCAMLFIVWRHWWVTLIYGAVMMALAIFCFVIRFYFVGIYFLVLTIVLLYIAALRCSKLIVSAAPRARAIRRYREDCERRALINDLERNRGAFIRQIERQDCYEPQTNSSAQHSSGWRVHCSARQLSR